MQNLTATVIKSVNGGCWSCFSCCRPKIIYMSDYCKNAKIIYVKKTDVLDDSTLRQIYENNALYERLCVNNKTLL